MYYEIIYEEELHRMHNREMELTKGPESGNYIPGLHTSIHWIEAMYKAIISTDIDKSKCRDKGKNIVEVQRSRVAF